MEYLSNLHLLWYGVGILAVIGVISLLFADKINMILNKVEYYASGRVTEHHKYQPFD